MAIVNNPYERQHIANLAKYGRLIDAIFKQATIEAASISNVIDNFDDSRVFSFNDYPITHGMVQSLLSRLGNGVETTIVNGINAEWTLANNKNNELSRRVFGENIGRLTQEQYRRYFSTNGQALDAFLQRKEQGLNLSERVWRYAAEFKSDIELGLDVGIRSGLDAPAIARELQQFLQHPDMLFRRVRDEHGELVLSQRAADYHPGQGVYRSSYKNARRLAVTETNIAYRSADYERWQQLDFVVGIEIKLSNNHTVHDSKGNIVPLYDICDELKGRYPKDFKFTGWHPHCRCHVETILKTEEELMEENRAILAGEEPSHASVNAVSDVPDNFKGWIVRNEERIRHARTIPYFMRDNGTVDGGKFELKEFALAVSTYTLPPLNSFTITRTRAGFMSETEASQILMDIVNSNAHLINGNITQVYFADRDYLMANYHPHGVLDRSEIHLVISTREQNTGFYQVNMSIELRNALAKIAKGKELTFDQEYAIESLWHELRHAQAIGYKNLSAATESRTAIMETINQFCARQTYPQFLESIGGKAVHQAAIIEDGYGYKTNLKHFHSLLERFGISKEAANQYFVGKIETTPYEDILEEVAEYVAGKAKKPKDQMRRLLQYIDAHDADFYTMLDFVGKLKSV